MSASSGKCWVISLPRHYTTIITTYDTEDLSATLSHYPSTTPPSSPHMTQKIFLQLWAITQALHHHHHHIWHRRSFCNSEPLPKHYTTIITTDDTEDLSATLSHYPGTTPPSSPHMTQKTFLQLWAITQALHHHHHHIWHRRPFCNSEPLPRHYTTIITTANNTPVSWRDTNEVGTYGYSTK